MSVINKQSKNLPTSKDKQQSSESTNLQFQNSKISKATSYSCSSCNVILSRSSFQECLICRRTLCIDCLKKDSSLTENDKKKSKSGSVCGNCLQESSNQRKKKEIAMQITHERYMEKNTEEEGINDNNIQEKSSQKEMKNVEEQPSEQITNRNKRKWQRKRKSQKSQKFEIEFGENTSKNQISNKLNMESNSHNQAEDTGKILDLDYLQQCVTPPSELYDPNINAKDENKNNNIKEIVEEITKDNNCLKGKFITKDRIINNLHKYNNKNTNMNRPNKSNNASLLRNKRRIQLGNEGTEHRPRRQTNFNKNYSRPEIKPVNFSKISNIVECHHCKQEVSLSNCLNCLNVKCNKSYCLSCINKYPKSSVFAECFYCKGICRCEVCLRNQNNNSLVLIEDNYDITVFKSALDSIEFDETNEKAGDQKKQVVDIEGFCIIEDNQSQDSENFVEQIQEEEKEEEEEKDEKSDLQSAANYQGNFRNISISFNDSMQNRKAKRRNRNNFTKKMANNHLNTKNNNSINNLNQNNQKYGNEKSGNIIKIPTDKKYPFESDNRITQIIQRVCSNSALNPRFKTKKDCFICRQSNATSQYRFKCFTDFMVFCRQHFSMNEYKTRSFTNEHLAKNIENLNEYYKSYFLTYYSESSQPYKSVKYICHNCLESKMFLENGFYELYNLMLLSHIKMDLFNKSSAYPLTINNPSTKPTANCVNFYVNNIKKNNTENPTQNTDSNIKNNNFSNINSTLNNNNNNKNIPEVLDNMLNEMNNFNLNFGNNNENIDIRHQIQAIILINQIWQCRNEKLANNPTMMASFYNRLKEVVENNPALFNVVNSINEIFKTHKFSGNESDILNNLMSNNIINLINNNNNNINNNNNMNSSNNPQNMLGNENNMNLLANLQGIPNMQMVNNNTLNNLAMYGLNNFNGNNMNIGLYQEMLMKQMQQQQQQYPEDSTMKMLFLQHLNQNRMTNNLDGNETVTDGQTNMENSINNNLNQNNNISLQQLNNTLFNTQNINIGLKSKSIDQDNNEVEKNIINSENEEINKDGKEEKEEIEHSNKGDNLISEKKSVEKVEDEEIENNNNNDDIRIEEDKGNNEGKDLQALNAEDQHPQQQNNNLIKDSNNNSSSLNNPNNNTLANFESLLNLQSLNNASKNNLLFNNDPSTMQFHEALQRQLMNNNDGLNSNLNLNNPEFYNSFLRLNQNNNITNSNANDMNFNGFFRNLIHEWNAYNTNYKNEIKNVFSKDDFVMFQESSSNLFNQIYQDFEKLQNQFNNPMKGKKETKSISKEIALNANETEDKEKDKKDENQVETNCLADTKIEDEKLEKNHERINEDENSKVKKATHLQEEQEKFDEKEEMIEERDSINYAKRNMCFILDELKRQFFSIQYFSLLQKLYTSYIFKNLELFVENITKYHTLSEIVSNNILNLTQNKDELLMNYTHYLKNITFIGSNLSNALSINLNNLKFNGIKIFNSLENSLKSNLKTVIDNFEEAYNLIVDEPKNRNPGEGEQMCNQENQGENEIVIEPEENEDKDIEISIKEYNAYNEKKDLINRAAEEEEEDDFSSSKVSNKAMKSEFSAKMNVETEEERLVERKEKKVEDDNKGKKVEVKCENNAKDSENCNEKMAVEKENEDKKDDDE